MERWPGGGGGGRVVVDSGMWKVEMGMGLGMGIKHMAFMDGIG